MAIRLFFKPRTRATRVRWLLEELRVPYELVRVDQLPAGVDYRSIHPLGLVPALSDGEVTLFETGAICSYLADKYIDRGLTPPLDSPLRAPYHQWMYFVPLNLESPVLSALQGDAAQRQRSQRSFDSLAPVIEAPLSRGPWLLGEGFSVADVAMGSVLNWARVAGLLETHPVLQRYAERIAERPAAKKAWYT